MKNKFFLSIPLILLSVAILFMLPNYAWAEDGAFQQPTVAIPTVTGTPSGVTATVLLDQPDPVSIRTGPNVFYEKIGSLQAGQTVYVKGRSAGGEWLYIEYPGNPGVYAWVYAPLFVLSPGELQIIEPPSTPTPEITQTINPTYASQFITTPNPTRMPTYTPGDRLSVPKYEDTFTSSFVGRIPAGLIIIILGGFGGLLALFSFIRSR